MEAKTSQMASYAPNVVIVEHTFVCIMDNDIVMMNIQWSNGKNVDKEGGLGL
jgi:hypothetical protein